MLIRTVFISALLAIGITGKAQSIDSFFISKYSQFLVDTGTYLPAAHFIDKDGHKKTLADFKGKILYIGLWSASCGTSIAEFPYQEQLLKRLKEIDIDTAFQLINIHIDDSKKEWKKALKEYNPGGINLFCKNTNILTKWNLFAPPAYVLLNASGKVLAKDISQPDAAGQIDYILYCATQGISPAEALMRDYEQSKLFMKNNTGGVYIDEQYKTWFNLTIKSFIEFQNWRKEHTKKRAF